MRTYWLIPILFLLCPPRGACQEARDMGLKGRVHTVFTEEFSDQETGAMEFRGSVLDVYDPDGYQIETYHYNSDGSLWVHTIFSRKGWQILGWQTTGSAPFGNSSVQQIYDSDGSVIETDTLDGSGTLTMRSTSESVRQGESTTTISRETGLDGTETVQEIVESTDPKTGITHQITTTDGKTRSDWFIQSDASGNLVRDKITYADGSYTERERKPDGSTVENRYWPLTNGHTYQKNDPQGHPIEVIQGSGTEYIRCTYSFDDKTGRPTGQINYDRAGDVLDRSTVEYQDDSQGNWISKRDTSFIQNKNDHEIVSISYRTIEYYQ